MEPQARYTPDQHDEHAVNLVRQVSTAITAASVARLHRDRLVRVIGERASKDFVDRSPRPVLHHRLKAIGRAL